MPAELKKIPFFEYQLFTGSVGEVASALDIAKETMVINTINPHSFYMADHDPVFKKSLIDSDILLADGIGIVYANAMINMSIIKKIAGFDLFLTILSQMEQSQRPDDKRVFLLGSSQEVLNTMKTKIAVDFPSLNVAFFSPSFKSEFSKEDSFEMIGHINAFHPYALFVGMTAPKQEKWVYLNKSAIHAKCISSIGAVFDFYSGRIQRPGVGWRIFGMEWLGRFASEPRRLWRRYLISLPYYIGKVFSMTVKKRLQ